MFYPVKVLEPKGTVKKIISSEELSKKHWNNFGLSEIHIGGGDSGYKFPSKRKKIQVKNSSKRNKKKDQQKIIN